MHPKKQRNTSIPCVRVGEALYGHWGIFVEFDAQWGIQDRCIPLHWQPPFKKPAARMVLLLQIKWRYRMLVGIWNVPSFHQFHWNVFIIFLARELCLPICIYCILLYNSYQFILDLSSRFQAVAGLQVSQQAPHASLQGCGTKESAKVHHCDSKFWWPHRCLGFQRSVEPWCQESGWKRFEAEKIGRSFVWVGGVW